MSFYYVYIIKSLSYKDKYYIGFTRDLKDRLIRHNQGRSTYTKSFRPWIYETTIAFRDKQLAINFEKYLKTGSGKAFMNKRLVERYKSTSEY